MKKDIKTQVTSLDQEADSRQAVLLRRADQQDDHLREISHKLDGAYKSLILNVRGVLSGDISVGNFRKLRSTMSSSKQIESQVNKAKNQQPDTATQSSNLLRSNFLRLRLPRSIGTSLWGNLMPFSEKILYYLRKNMKTNFEIYSQVLKLQTSITQNMPVSQQDSIHFVDVLGRSADLPYEYFRHWEIFESRLRCEFKGLPGEKKVLRGEYFLINPAIHGVKFGKDTWQYSVLPGTRVTMAVVIKSICISRGSCPRPQCLGKVDYPAEPSVAHCPDCGLNFVPQILRKYLERGPDTTKGKVFQESPISSTDGDSLALKRFKKLEFEETAEVEREKQEVSFFRLIHLQNKFHEELRFKIFWLESLDELCHMTHFFENALKCHPRCQIFRLYFEYHLPLEGESYMLHLLRCEDLSYM